MSNSENSIEHIKINKYIDCKSDEDEDEDVIHIKNIKTNSEKIILLSEKLGIDIYTNKKKVKRYDVLICLCNKKKRDIIKKYVMILANYTTKKGYAALAGTYVIESSSDAMIEQLKKVDKLIQLINTEYTPPKKHNILTLMRIKKYSNEIDDLLEEYSD